MQLSLQDRLKPIGAEELIQYYMMKLASEEARVHSDESLLDKKSTMCLEGYIQWFNRLTSFVTTEVLKHTHRNSRVRFIDYFLDAAEECLRLHNFNSMAAILGMKEDRRLSLEKQKLDDRWCFISGVEFNHVFNDICQPKRTTDHWIKERNLFPWALHSHCRSGRLMTDPPSFSSRQPDDVF